MREKTRACVMKMDAIGKGIHSTVTVSMKIPLLIWQKLSNMNSSYGFTFNLSFEKIKKNLENPRKFQKILKILENPKISLRILESLTF